MRFLRQKLQALYKKDQAIHSFIAAKFPRSLAMVDKTLSGIHGIVSHGASGVLATILLGVLVLTGIVDKVVGISVWIAWLVVFIWFARASWVKRLTIVTRIFVMLLIGALLAVAGRTFGHWCLNQYHQQEQRKKLDESQRGAVASAPTPTTLPFDCLTEEGELRQQYLADPKNKKEDFPSWLSRQMREREVPCKIDPREKQQASKHRGNPKSKAAVPVPVLPTAVEVHGGKNIDVSHVQGGKVNMDGVENGTVSHVGDKTANIPTPTPAPTPPL